jgi:hypothetical protein
VTGAAAPLPPTAPDGPSPWADVLRTPRRGGALGGLLRLVPPVAALSRLVGGVGDDSWRLFLQPVLVLVTLVLLGVWARRIALCTVEDRAVPWLRDERDTTSWVQDVASFAAMLLLALLPTLVASLALSALGAPSWTAWLAAFAGLAVAAIHLPFALASSVLRQGGFGAGYGGTFRAWRANRDAATIAVAPTAVFFALVVLSVLLASWLVPHYAEENASDNPVKRYAMDHTTSREVGRWVVFAVRVVAVWAALCSFRVAGLLARDVPEAREALS